VDESGRDLVVVDKRSLSDAVVAVTLRPPSAQPLPPWSPGAHIDMVLGPDHLVRQYSLCGEPSDRSRYEIAVLREPHGRGGSQYVHDILEVDDLVRIGGPRNKFELLASPRYVFVAGGIGITPLLPMLATVAAAENTHWRLLYGGRSRESMVFVDELARYGGRVALCPEDESGLPDLAALLGTPTEDTLVYSCGPEPMLAAVEKLCTAWPSGALHIERFAPGPPAEHVNVPFEVTLEKSGITLKIPADRSILEVVEEAGIPAMSSCGEGTCGTCEVSVLEGRPDHRDSVLSDEERDGCAMMMVCVSRAEGGRLVLDL
jgi:ferredoxin-NADP reductase